MWGIFKWLLMIRFPLQKAFAGYSLENGPELSNSHGDMGYLMVKRYLRVTDEDSMVAGKKG